MNKPLLIIELLNLITKNNIYIKKNEGRTKKFVFDTLKNKLYRSNTLPLIL